MSTNSFDARTTLEVSGTTYEIFDLHKVEGSDTLPFSLKVLLENLLRTEDGANITADDIRALGAWEPSDEPNREIQFTPARVIMQDFTGVPCVVDLATMREAIAELGGDPAKVNPLSPAEMVIDHSVVADLFGTPDAFVRNVRFRRGAGDTGIVLGWKSDEDGPDFKATNTFEEMPTCAVSHWRRMDGSCPNGQPECL